MILVTWGDNETTLVEDADEAREFINENKEYLNALSSAKVFEIGKQIVVD